MKSIKDKLLNFRKFSEKVYFSPIIYLLLVFSLSFCDCTSNDSDDYSKSNKYKNSITDLQLKSKSMIFESLSNELAAHWMLDEGEGTTASDSSENDNIGSIIGAQWTDGKTGEGALSFDGIDDYVDCGTDESLNISNKITVAAWIYNQEDREIGGPRGWGAIPISKGDYRDDGWYWWIDSNGWRLSANSLDNWIRISSTYDVPLEEWHHLASVIDNDNLLINFYVDGELKSSSSMPFALTLNIDRPLYLGRYSSSTNYNWKGKMDDVCIFNEALSQSDIKSLSGISHSSLKAHWMFEGNANDSSGNGNDGAVHGTTWIEGIIGQSLSFDGVNDYVDCGDDESLVSNDTITISAWVNNQQDMGSTAVAISKGNYREDGWYWWIDHKSWRISVNSPDNYARISSHYRIPYNEWHHLVSIIDNINLQIHFYVDGDLLATEDLPFSIIGNPNRSLNLGRYEKNVNYNWKGALDDVRIYNTTLSEFEIQELYQMGNPVTPPPPPPEAPDAPSNLIAQAVSTTQIKLTWLDNSNNEEGFKIERRLSANSVECTSFTVAENEMTFLDDSLNPDTTYYYRVIAYNNAGNSNLSNSNANTLPESDNDFRPYQLNLPDYDSNNPEMMLIESNSDWNHINDSNKRFFFVTPGSYRLFIKFTSSGTKESPRYLIYYDPSNPNDETHPANMSASKRASIKCFAFIGARYWIVDRLSVLDSGNERNSISGKDSNSPTEERHSSEGFSASRYTPSSHNIFNRLFISGGSEDSIIIYEGCSYNTIQNSVICEQTLPDHDWVGILLQAYRGRSGYAEIIGTRIIANEIYNVNDGIQIFDHPDIPRIPSYAGTIIADNDLYLTPARYTDGDGHFTTSGGFAAAENAIDIKAGSPDSDNPMYIVGNRMWGFRYIDQSGIAGSNDHGAALAYHDGGQYRGYDGRYAYIMIRDNIVFDSAQGIVGEDLHHISVVNNVIWDISAHGCTLNKHFLALDLNISNAEFYRNTIIDSGLSNQKMEYWFWARGSSSSFDFRENVIINCEHKFFDVSSTTCLTDYNFFYNVGERLNGDHNIVRSTASESGNSNLNVTIKRITDPQIITIPYGLSTESSPHHNAGDPNLGSISNMGINNQLY